MRPCMHGELWFGARGFSFASLWGLEELWWRERLPLQDVTTASFVTVYCAVGASESCQSVCFSMNDTVLKKGYTPVYIERPCTLRVSTANIAGGGSNDSNDNAGG